MTTDQLTEDTPFTAEDDQYHQLSDAPNELETNWWSLNVPERRLGLWLWAGYHPNQQAVTWRVFAWDPSGSDPGRLAYYREAAAVPMPPDPDLRDITFPGGGYRLRMLEPLTRYHLTFADPDADFALDVEFHGGHPPQRFTPGQAPMLHSPHLDQLGHVVGELVLRGERIPVDCWSVRDRTWGPRGTAPGSPPPPPAPARDHRPSHPGGPRWREVERERGRGRIQYIFGHTDDRTGFLGFVRPQDGDASGWSPMNVGWLIKDGRLERLDPSRSRMRNHRDPWTGWSAHMDVVLVDRTGRTMEAEGFALSHQSNGAGSNALMRWEYGGQVGWGEDQDVWSLPHFQKMLRAMQTTTAT